MGPRYEAHIYPQDADPAPLHATRLVSCCPGLQDLDLMDWFYYPELLALLRGLSSLSRLVTGSLSNNSQALKDVVGHLTGLRDLRLWMPSARALEGDLWQLTQLQELTRLSYVYYSGRVILTQVGACRMTHRLSLRPLRAVVYACTCLPSTHLLTQHSMIIGPCMLTLLLCPAPMSMPCAVCLCRTLGRSRCGASLCGSNWTRSSTKRWPSIGPGLLLLRSEVPTAW